MGIDYLSKSLTTTGKIYSSSGQQFILRKKYIVKKYIKRTYLFFYFFVFIELIEVISMIIEEYKSEFCLIRVDDEEFITEEKSEETLKTILSLLMENLKITM